MFRNEGRTLTYNSFTLQIVTWMKNFFIGTYNTYSYIYLNAIEISHPHFNDDAHKTINHLHIYMYVKF